MPDDTKLKERLRRAADQPAPEPLLDAVSARAGRLRLRRAVGGAVAVVVVAAAVALPLSGLRHLGDATAPTQVGGIGDRLTFAAADGWWVVDSAGALPDLTQGAMTANFDVAPLLPPEALVDGHLSSWWWIPPLEQMSPHDVVVSAQCCGSVNPSAPNTGSPATELPFTLPQRSPETHWEGTTYGTSRYRVFGTVEGNALEVDVYFGTDAPAPSMISDAQTALERLIAPPSPTPTNTLELGGIHMDLAPGWDGQLTAANGLRASTIPLAADDGVSFMPNRSALGANDASIVVVENDGVNVGYPHAEPPFAVGVRDICQGCEVADDGTRSPDDHTLYHRTFETSGREFDLWVETGSAPPSDEAITRVALVLDTLRISRAGIGGEQLSMFVAQSGVSIGIPADWHWTAETAPEGMTLRVASVPLDDPVHAWTHLGPDDAMISFDENQGHDPDAYPVLDGPIVLADDDVCTDCMEGLPAGYGAWTSRFRVGQRPFAITIGFGSFPAPADVLARVNAILATLVVDADGSTALPELPEGSEVGGSSSASVPFAFEGIQGEVPPDWRLRTNPVPGLVEPVVLFAAASYPFAAGGDCGPDDGIRALPADGVFTWLYEYRQRPGNAGDFVASIPSWNRISWRDEPTAYYECSPWTPTAMFRFRVGDRFFQLHVAIGAKAGNRDLERLSALLTSFEWVQPQGP